MNAQAETVSVRLERLEPAVLVLPVALNSPISKRQDSMAHRVLLSVEDNDGEYYLIQLAIREAGIPVEVCRVADGEQALHFLHRSNGYEIAPRPDLILLNLNLPRKTGLEVLSDIQTSDSLRSIPVVMFTSSALNAERKKALALGAEEFISKPLSLDGLLEAVRSLCWRYLAPEAGQ